MMMYSLDTTSGAMMQPFLLIELGNSQNLWPVRAEKIAQYRKASEAYSECFAPVLCVLWQCFCKGL